MKRECKQMTNGTGETRVFQMDVRINGPINAHRIFQYILMEYVTLNLSS